MKKRIISFLLVLIMLFGLTPMTLLTAFAQTVEETINPTPKVSIEPETKNEQYGDSTAKPDASGYAHFVIKADPAPENPVWVHYTTADLSAIADSGDYYAQSGTIVLTKEQPERKVVVSTNRTEYSVSTQYTASRKVSYEARRFEVVISVVSEGAVLDEKNSRAQCALDAEYNFTAFRYESTYTDKPIVFSAYTNAHTATYGGRYLLRDFLVTSAWSNEDEPFVKSTKAEFPMEHWEAYLYSPINADLFMALNDAHVDESSWNSSSMIEVRVGGVCVFLKGEFHDDEDFGWGPALAYIIGGNPGENNRYKTYFEDNFRELQWEHVDGWSALLKMMDRKLDEEGLNYLTEEDFIVAYNNNLFIAREYDSFGSVNGTPDPEDYWVRLSDKKSYTILNSSEIQIRFWTYGGFSRRLTEGDVAYRLEDINAPVLEKDGNAYSIYNNFSIARNGEKLRLTLRFNEPVQVFGKTPFISGKVNGRGTGSLTDPYTIRFDYAGGSGSDTLYFEADYTGNYNITSITDLVFTNGSSIMDFAGLANSFVPEKFSISGFSVDRRDPYISVDNPTFTGNSDFVKSASTEVTVSQISSGATLYYAWTNSESTPASYDSEIVLNDVSINETQTVNINGGGNGKRFLHLKVVSWYGKTSTAVLNSKTGLTKAYLGPYYFDNSAPTIDRAVIPLSTSDLKNKVYKIPLPTDNPSDAASGFYEMYVYYQMPDGTGGVIEREKILLPHQDANHAADAILEKDFKADESGTKYLNITIEAADIGIGEKTRVENVEIYFVLKDNLGNVDTNVSRHSVVFDTNEYVNVISTGASQEFVGKTEKLDGENTLIYSNDKTALYNGETVYYSYEFKIREDTADCQNLFSVVKIGETSEDNVIITEGYEVVTVPGENGEKTVIIKFTSPIEDGCYDIQLMCYDADSSQTEKADRVSDVYRFYIGTGVGKLGEKINAGTVLINKVYQLPSSSGLYYMEKPEFSGSEFINSVLTDYYNSDRLAMSFSTFEAARKFVLFNEYRDLYAVTLTEAMADALNSRTTSLQPAQGEETVAMAGQVWVRYKSVSWTLGSKQTSHWVYYYYGSTTVLNPDHFSPILNEALNSVSDLIAKSGKTVALTDLSLKNNSGASLLDKNGAPYLSPSQIVTSDRYLTDSITPISSFAKEITYSADMAIYSSKVVMTNPGVAREYVIVGNVCVPLGSRFQYRRYDSIGSGFLSSVWSEILLTKTDGTQRFSEVVAEDGWYEIRELGVDGVTVFDVYIDKKAPLLSVSWNDKNNTLQNHWLSADSASDFRARSFEITGIDSFEADKFSYVAIYSMTSAELYGVYTATELQRASVSLPDGRYYIVVADRSGNSYYMSIYVNSTGMNCNVEETANVKIKFTCDRDSSQIQTFYVKRNGIRIENVHYSNSITFTESGIYEFYVEDIYGNTYGPVQHEFKRDYPELTWSYLLSDGYFSIYDSENADAAGCFKLEKKSDGSYRIISSVQMRFQLKGDFGYEFIGTAPEITKNEIYNYVTIHSTQSFQLKVYYREHPEVYTVYNCSADKNAPSISVSAQVYEFGQAEIELLREAVREALASGNTIGEVGSILEDGVSLDGRFLTPSTIAFLAGRTQTKFLVDGENTLSDFINVNAKDENGIQSLKIYLDGVLLNEQTEDEGISDVILSRYGEYRIVAEDTLGNVSEFVFRNARPDAFSYCVDGEDIELGIHDYQNFDQNLNYTAVNYGNASVSHNIHKQMSVFYMITDTGGEKIFVAFDVNDSTVTQLHYFLRDGATAPELLAGELLFDGKNGDKTGSEYLIYEQSGVSIFAKLDAEGNVELRLYSKDDGIMTVEARLSTPDGEFYYNKTELSKLPFELDFKVDGSIREDVTATGQININKPFEIVDGGKAAYGEVYYSRLNDIDADNLNGRENIYGEESFSAEGFYLIKARDKYGNECAYRIHLSDDFEVTSYVELYDGQKLHYSPNYENTLYSDFKIVFELHSNDVTVTAKKNGNTLLPLIVAEDGITYVTIAETGAYDLSFSDSYGNTVDFSAQIDTAGFSFNENLLTGYNENALKRDEGYTNQKLSAVESELDTVYYLAIRFADELNVIYDVLSEDKRSFDSAALNECVGRLGDGEYTVIVRNRYGSLATKTIHYRATPTLVLERETRNSTESEPYSLEDAISLGFWSNNALMFKTEASVYTFTVNGVNAECPKKIFYATSGQYGRNEYDITYVDEYGFSYSFKAYLVRQELEISVSDGLPVRYVNDVLATKSGVSVIFSENAFCTYTLDNSEPKPYTVGQTLTSDGVYRFTVSDLAGNVAALTVKKDTVVEYYFKSNKGETLTNGGVVNYSKVDFSAANGDTAYIERVQRNGVLQSFSGTSFSEDGKWEIIVADKLGNKSYFSFYIITKAQNGFAYTTPYEYHISQLWYVGADGVKISYMNFVNHTDFDSSFNFTENGKYIVTMTSDLTGSASNFEFTVNTNAPSAQLVGCNSGETTINDVTLTGCRVGDRIKIYKNTDMGEKLLAEVVITSDATQIPSITEGGEYRIVVESEAGVSTEFSFVRKHVMNTAGSILVMVVIGIAAVGLFAGLIYRNKSKTDD